MKNYYSKLNLLSYVFMPSYILSVSLLILVMVFFSKVHASDTASEQVQSMIIETAKEFLKHIQERRTELEGNKTALRQLTNEIVKPKVDTYRMARYVMAAQWRIATEEQKQKFVEYFTNMLIDSYGNSLLKLKIKSNKIDKITNDRGKFIVYMNVVLEDETNAKISYKVYTSKNTDAKQKYLIYDFVIENISMLVNYRNIYKEEFNNKGIKRVLQKMAEDYS